MWDLLAALAVVSLAELGDKSQFAILGLAARSRPLPVWLGATLAFALLSALAALAGAAAAAWVPSLAVQLVSGLLFLGLGLLGLLRRGEDGEEAARPLKRPFAATFGLILLAELGDKTQLATAALAAGGSPVLAGLGAFAALALGAALAAWAGSWLARRVKPGPLRVASSVLFLLVGAATLLLLLRR